MINMWRYLVKRGVRFCDLDVAVIIQQNLLSTYCVPDTIPGAWCTSVNKQKKIPFFNVADILAGMRCWETLINIIELSHKSEHDKCYGENN